GSRPNADTSTPGQPTLITPFTGVAYLDNRGYTRARVILSWNAPNNTDGSTVFDGDRYEIRYAVDTDMLYPSTWAQLSAARWQDLQTWSQPFAAPTGKWSTMVVNWDTTTAQLQDLSPGVGYDVQIRAVDKTGNIGAWSSTTTFVASSDNLPPSTPAAPTVAGSRIAVQVTHTLGKSSGGTFNLESDLDHLEIHVSYEPTFTPTAATLVGKTAANASMIQAQIPVVFTAQIEETSARYVRVVAVDKTGNKSGPSDAASATALLIDDAHISDLTVSKVTAGTITAAWVMAGEIKTADTG
ncbi:fibronectin type III domain-containing protein, partial [Streptomyces sp. EN23]